MVRANMRTLIKSFAVFVSSMMVLVGTANAALSTFSIFPNRGFQIPGSTTNGVNILDSDPSTIATFNSGGVVILDFGQDITNNSFTISVDQVLGAAAQISVRFIFTTPGPGATFTDIAPADFPFASVLDFVVDIDGPGDFFVPGGFFSAECQAIGGCNSALINVTSATGFTAGIASSAPEPAIWALMIMGFAGVAYQAKRNRRQAVLTVRT